MPTDKDYALVDYLLKGTEAGQIKWEPTAVREQFATSLKGKYNIIVDKSEEDRREEYWLQLRDAENRELMSLYDSEYQNVKVLFDLARRTSLKVDAAIDEIIGNIQF